MAPNEHHRPHPHFYCKRCGRMDCLPPEILNVETAALRKTFPGRIDKVEIRVDGICKNCMK
jgi:Fur family ferric uptake transcriptional regulator